MCGGNKTLLGLYVIDNIVTWEESGNLYIFSKSEQECVYR